MTDEVRARIEYYLEKLGTWPHVNNLSKDFSISKELAKELLDEYREKYYVKKPVLPPSPAESRKETILHLSQEEFNKITKKDEVKKDEKPTDFHETLVRQGAGIIVLRIFSGLVGIACIVRGFMVILSINSTIGWQGYVNAIIFQGGSAILPIVAMVYFSAISKRTWYNVIFGFIYLSGGAGSMSYEVYASITAFHETNIKQEIKNQNQSPIAQDFQILAIQSKIDSENKTKARIEALLAQRVEELDKIIRDNGDSKAVQTATGRVATNRADLEASESRLRQYNDDLLARSKTLESESKSNASSLSMISNNNQDTKNLLELLITTIPSAMMVFFTPVFFGFALFGINVRRKE